MIDLPTPYDGSSRPFEIGLKQLDPADWIEIDDRLVEYLDRKERLIAGERATVFAAEPGTYDAQAEVLDLLAEHLLGRFPDLYRRDGASIHLLSAGRKIDTRGDPDPLLTASRLVQEDLVLMRRGEDGWRLAAAGLCFPSSWSLAEKFGRPLDAIHAPVPGFQAGTRPAALIARMFDALSPGRPVWRANWSLQADDELHKPLAEAGRIERAGQAVSRFVEGGALFIRVERQTLRKLPASGDILFTIRIHVDPLERLHGHPEAAAIAASFAAQLRSLDAAQLAYKGLAADRDLLVARLMAV
jgi:dimethylamine monooxygenase subunit A